MNGNFGNAKKKKKKNLESHEVASLPTKTLVVLVLSEGLSESLLIFQNTPLMLIFFGHSRLGYGFSRKG